MIANYPLVNEQNGAVKLEFCSCKEGLISKPIDMVLDFDQFGCLLGIEIISLAFHAGKNCLDVITGLVATSGEGVRFSYDRDSDSFYLRLRSGKSVEQKVVKGSMLIDNGGRILVLNAEWQSAK